MTLKIYKNIKFNGVNLKSGWFYEFKYSPYQEDPKPMLIFISAIKGKHPNSGHVGNLIQGINLNYIPRKDRKNFVNIGKTNIESGKPVEFTGEIVKSKYPYLKGSIRRYLLKPNYYIRNLKEIEFKKIDKEVIRSLPKDFSKSLFRKIGAAAKKFFVGKRK